MVEGEVSSGGCTKPEFFLAEMKAITLIFIWDIFLWEKNHIVLPLDKVIQGHFSLYLFFCWTELL